MGSASANPDCPWFVPFPAHSYVIICDKHLGGKVTNPPQRSVFFFCPATPPTKTTRANRGSRMCRKGERKYKLSTLPHLVTQRFAQTKLRTAAWSCFCVSGPREDKILAATLTLSAVLQTGAFPVVPSTFPSQH